MGRAGRGGWFDRKCPAGKETQHCPKEALCRRLGQPQPDAAAGPAAGEGMLSRQTLEEAGGEARGRRGRAQASAFSLEEGYSNGAGAGVDAERRTEAGDERLRALRQQVAEVGGDLSRDFGDGAVHHR